MAQEILAEPAQVFGHRQGPADYLYAIVEGLPRRWRPPTDGVGAAALGAATVLPLPFGTVLPTFEVEDWLASHLALIHAYLPRLRRHVEMTIMLVSLAPGGDARASLRATAERLVERTGASDWRYRDGGPEGPVSSLAFLVPRDGVGDFLARVAPVAARAGDVAVVPTGPWAPASFSPSLPVPGSGAGPERLAHAG